jgi:hypothetical protein
MQRLSHFGPNHRRFLVAELNNQVKRLAEQSLTSKLLKKLPMNQRTTAMKTSQMQLKHLTHKELATPQILEQSSGPKAEAAAESSCVSFAPSITLYSPELRQRDVGMLPFKDAGTMGKAKYKDALSKHSIEPKHLFRMRKNVLFRGYIQMKQRRCQIVVLERKRCSQMLW